MLGHPHDRVAGIGETLLYLDPWTGVSGDMLLGALLDTDRVEGRLEKALRDSLAGLGLGGSDLEIERVVERGLSCTQVRVCEEDSPPLRCLADMEKIIEKSPVSEWVRSSALESVRRFAAVEAEIHGCSVSQVHFHEVGGVDTLVDVVGTFVLIEALRVGRVIVGPIPVGGGTVEIAHGRMQVPAPATAVLLQGYATRQGPEMRELTTPTGALLLKGLGAETGGWPLMLVERTGYGAGGMKLEGGPNVLRAVIGREVEAEGLLEQGQGSDTVVELQTNIDDVSPEVVGHVCGLLRDAGALDVWTVAAHMKKDRPGMVLHVLVQPSDERAMVEALVVQTGTLGIRRQALSRWLVDRGTIEVSVLGHEVRVKWGRWHGRLVSLAAEYEDAAVVAAGTGVPLSTVMQTAVEAARQRLS